MIKSLARSHRESGPPTRNVQLENHSRSLQQLLAAPIAKSE